MKNLIFLLTIISLQFYSCSSEICENNCPYSNDGICDDGGEGDDDAVAECEYGYDCNDCGPRKRNR